jgi:hypothetical protein
MNFLPCVGQSNTMNNGSLSANASVPHTHIEKPQPNLLVLPKKQVEHRLMNHVLLKS